jgi:hypothetical protein
MQAILPRDAFIAGILAGLLFGAIGGVLAALVVMGAVRIDARAQRARR